MGLALTQAKLAYDLGEVPIGAVIVLNGEVIASAHNMRETWLDATAHAEIIAVKTACQKIKTWRLTGASIYVTIEPCPMCAGALVMSRMERLVYGSSDYKAGAVGGHVNIERNCALNYALAVTGGGRAGECCGVMKGFFQARRKQKL